MGGGKLLGNRSRGKTNRHRYSWNKGYSIGVEIF